MLRRRPRPRRPGPAMRRLNRARELFERGKYGEAAALFSELAQGAEDRGMRDRAGDLRLRVAQCYLKLEDADRADKEALHALSLFLQARRPQKVRQLLPKVIAALEKQGKHAEAKELKERAERLLGAGPGGRGRAAARGTLPGKCPNCGGPIRPDEIEWLGRTSAECPYCGGVVTAK